MKYVNILGKLCWYSCPDAVTIRADVLDDRLRVAGWEKAVPSRRGPADALRRALADLHTTFPHLSSAVHNDGWGVWGVFDRDGRRARKILMHLELVGGNIRRTLPAPLDENYHSPARQALTWVSQRYNFYRTYHDTHKVRTCVNEVMSLLGFLHIRPGCFFIPNQKADALGEVREVFSPGIFDRGFIHFTIMRWVDSPEDRAELAGDILHNIEEYLERIRIALLRHDLGESDLPHPETMRDWLRRMSEITDTIEYFRAHVLGEGITPPEDLPELIERVSALRAERTGKDRPNESLVA